MGALGVTKYTFNEISNAETSSFMVPLGQLDDQEEATDPTFKFCFII